MAMARSGSNHRIVRHSLLFGRVLKGTLAVKQAAEGAFPAGRRGTASRGWRVTVSGYDDGDGNLRCVAAVPAGSVQPAAGEAPAGGEAETAATPTAGPGTDADTVDAADAADAAAAKGLGAADSGAGSGSDTEESALVAFFVAFALILLVIGACAAFNPALAAVLARHSATPQPAAADGGQPEHTHDAAANAHVGKHSINTVLSAYTDDPHVSARQSTV